MHSRPSIRATIFVAGVFLLMAARLMWLVAHNQVNLLYSDEWDLYRQFMRGASWQELFLYQPGPHRQGIGYILMSWIAGASRWNTRVMAFVSLGISIGSAALALGLQRRLAGTLVASDAIIPLLFLSPIQYDDFLGPANLPTTTLPIFLMLLYTLSWTVTSRVLRYTLVLLLNFFLIYCGYALFIGFITPVLLALDLRAALRSPGSPPSPARQAEASGAVVAMLIALASLASFFVDYRIFPGCFRFTLASLKSVPWFMALMFVNVVRLKGDGALPTAMGAALIVLALGIVFRRGAVRVESSQPASLPWSRETARARAMVALAGFSLLYSFAAAVGRSCFGVDYGQTSRYAPYLFPAFLAFYFAAFEIPAARRRNAVLGIYAAALAVAAIFLAPRDRRTIAYYHHGKVAWKACYLREGDPAACTEQSGFQIYPNPADPRLRQELEYMRNRGLNLFAK